MGHLNFWSSVISGSGTVTLGSVLFRFDSLDKHFTSNRRLLTVVILAGGIVIKNM